MSLCNEAKRLILSLTKTIKYILYGISFALNRHLPHPLPMLYFKDDPVERARFSEKHLTSFMFPRKQSCLIDVGAGRGMWTFFVAGRGYEVHAFEPSCQSYSILEKHARKFPNVQLYPFALGERNGTASLYLHSTPGYDNLIKQRKDFTGKEKQVEVRSLDSFDIKNIGSIKIDTEGYEIPILYGAEKTIRLQKPRLVIEVHRPYKKQKQAITAFLKEIGYKWIIKYRTTIPPQPYLVGDPK